MTTLALMLLMREPAAPWAPRITIAFPLEGAVGVEFECRRSELARLIDDVLADERRVELIERAFVLVEEGEA